MSSSFSISLDLDLKTLSNITITVEELLTAFIESTAKRENEPLKSYRLEILLFPEGKKKQIP